MRLAVTALDPAPEVLLVDAVRVPGVAISPRCPLHGDALSASIAAASIVAKVHRDGLSRVRAALPGLRIRSHKGYGNRSTGRRCERCGPCPEHRLTYRGVVPEPGAEATRAVRRAVAVRI